MQTEMNDPTLFKILGHPERYAILQRLMSQQATLTQLGKVFKKSPANIRHHLVLLEQAGLVEFAEARSVQGGPEKYYRATQRAMFIHHAILPQRTTNKAVITIGSMDSGIKRIAKLLAQKSLPFELAPVPLSSLDGLIALRQGLCQVSTTHLIDPATEEFNRSYIRHLFPIQTMGLVTVFRREEGLIVGAGNPMGLRTFDDLARPDIRFINREPGSGVRQWVDLQVKCLGIGTEVIPGYANFVKSHRSVARTVSEGRADVGVGIASAAMELGLDFIPLFEEPYEIAVPLDLVADPQVQLLFEILNSGEVRTALENLGGYSIPQNSGRLEVIG